MKINRRKHSRIFFILVGLFFFVLLLLPDPVKVETRDYSQVILDKDEHILRVFLSSNQQWYLPPDNDFKIPPKLEKAVLAFEDNWFYYHPGLNPVSIIRAFLLNLRQKRIISGGSTITMQLIRVTGSKERTYWNKALEMLQALKTELKYSKEDILRMYLERAPYGGNIVGIKAASLKYYQKKPSELSWNEAATLAVLPNSPGMISPGKNQDKLIAKKNRLLKTLYRKKNITDTELSLSLSEPTPKVVTPFNFIAPHFTNFIRNTVSEPIVQTTLDYKLQTKLQELLRNYGKQIKEIGIENCAGIVVESKTGKIRAWIGSQDFTDHERSGQVDGVIAARSTGSILKPFLYAAAMDQGLLIPQTVLQDVPTHFKNFSPENSNFKYSGLVTAKSALTRSLNIPAVRLLNTYGLYNFYSFLKSSGVTTLFRTADEYGLTLIIGGSEIKLYDLAKLYVGLAQYGNFSDLQYLENQEQNNKVRLLSEGASYLTLDMLKDLDRPDAEMYWKSFSNKQEIAWKTGTSFGHRDAWAAGVTPEWTVCIWAGNFPGNPNPEIKGAEVAGSLMFRIFSLLSTSHEWFTPPYEDLVTRTICRHTGFLAGENCLETITALVPAKAGLLKKCPYHKKIYLSKDENYQVCSLCWGNSPGKEKVVLHYPPSVAEMLKQQGYSVYSLPPHNPDCSQYSAASQLMIRYPTAETVVLVPRDFSGKYQKIVMELSHAESDLEVFWYLDNKYLGSTIGKHNFSTDVTSGIHFLYVIDENGDNDSVRFSAIRNR